MKFSRFFLIIFSLFLFSACNSDDNETRDENVSFLNKLEKASENSQETGIHTMDFEKWGNTGMYYKVLRQGDGDYAIKGQTVTVSYIVWAYSNALSFDDYLSPDLSESRASDQGNSVQYTVGTSTLDGFTIALQSMRVGSKYRFYIPYNMGYGKYGYGSIEGYATLIFDIELESID